MLRVPPLRNLYQDLVNLTVSGLTNEERADLSRYQDDPVGFVHDCFVWRPNEGPTAYQDRILSLIPIHRRVAVRGPHGLGKTAIGAWFVLWIALCFDGEDWKVPTTASVGRQLTDYLWPEIHKWSRRLRWERIGRMPFNERSELLTIQLKGKTGSAFALTSDDPARLEGAHADIMGYLLDEAKTIQGKTFDAVEGAFAGAGTDTSAQAFALAISTPGAPAGRFYDICRHAPGYEDWHTVHVTLEEAIEAKRISAEWASQRAVQWGVSSAVYKNRVLGEFASSDADAVIPLEWVEAANERWRDWDAAGRPGKFFCVGVDVGRGGDATVHALRYRQAAYQNNGHSEQEWDAIAELRRSGTGDTMDTVGRTEGILHANGGYAHVDSIGIGAGVYDKMIEDKEAVVSFNAAQRSVLVDRSLEFTFANRRAEGWWTLRELLDPAFEPVLALPPDDLLTGDLTSPHWKVQTGARIVVEEKEHIRERLGRSTDSGDAVVQAVAVPVVPPEQQRVMYHNPVSISPV